MMEERTPQRGRERNKEEAVLKFSARKTVFIFRKVLHVLGWCSLWHLKAFQSRLLLLWKNLLLVWDEWVRNLLEEGKHDVCLRVPALWLVKDKESKQQDMSFEESGILCKKLCAWGNHITTLSPDT